LISINGLSQIEPKEIMASNLPQNISYKGEFLCAYEWIDSLGDNYLILSQSKITKSNSALKAKEGDIEFDNTDKEIYAIQYIISDSIIILWKLLDYVKDCSFDLTVDYLTQKPIIADLDKNGICEVWLVYWLGCRSDVSPLEMKLIMHIGKEKYAIRGNRMIRYGEGPDEIAGGEMRVDEALKKLPKVILDYSLSLWKKYKIESI
jgi:hypothetical protein